MTAKNAQSNQRAVCIILARGGSKGIPKKNLSLIAGRPLVDWSLKAAAESKIFSEIVISSDDSAILDRAKQFDALGLKRPDEFSSDLATSESALLHVVNERKYSDEQWICFLQPTSPLRSPADLIRSEKEFKEKKFDSVFSSVVVEDRFVWEESNGSNDTVKGSTTFESVTYDWRDRRRRQEIKRRFLENGSLYWFSVGQLRKTQNRLGGKIGTFIMEDWKHLQIDRPEAIEVASILIQAKLSKEWPGCLPS
jgi:CMP-N,N'-diacetyllegionaminic acid synthase